MSTDDGSGRTAGELKVEQLLKQLPEDDYWFYAEAKLVGVKSAHKNPDFVLVSRLRGVIVFEVKDWVELSGGDQKSVSIKRRDGKRVSEENPVFTAELYARSLANLFQKEKELLIYHEGKDRLCFPWSYAVILPNIQPAVIGQFTQDRVWEEGRVLGTDDLRNIHTFQQAILKIPMVFTRTRLEDTIFNVIRGVIKPSTIITDPQGKQIGIETPQQEKIIYADTPLPAASANGKHLSLMDDFLSSEAQQVSESHHIRLVRGVAGSGKSLVLARRAQFLADQHPDQKILVMAYNVELVEDLKCRIPGAHNLEVLPIGEIYFRILPDCGEPVSISDWALTTAADYLDPSWLTPEFIEDEIEWRKEMEYYDNEAYLNVLRKGRGQSLSLAKRRIINAIFDRYQHDHYHQNLVDWADVPRMALAELQKGHPLRHQYDFILIDEAQDFAPSWIQIVKRLLKPNGLLFMCDDPTQSLFRFFSWKTKGIDLVGRTHILRVPFRSTRQISILAYSLIASDKILSHSKSVTHPDLSSSEIVSGSKPKLIFCKDEDKEIKYVTHTALSFMEDGIPPEQIAILCHNKNYVRHWAALRDKGLEVLHYNTMKGLEFRVVFLPYLHTAFRHTNTADDGSEISNVYRRIFTAMTRARETLILSYHDRFPTELSPLELHVQRESGNFLSNKM